MQIFATDLNERTIEKARLGIYKKSALQDMDPERVDNSSSMSTVTTR